MERDERQAYLARLQLKAMLKNAMTKEAYERLERVKMANPELYAKAVQSVLYIYQTRGQKVDEQTLLALLKRLRGEKRQTKIKILRK